MIVGAKVWPWHISSDPLSRAVWSCALLNTLECLPVCRLEQICLRYCRQQFLESMYSRSSLTDFQLPSLRWHPDFCIPLPHPPHLPRIVQQGVAALGATVKFLLPTVLMILLSIHFFPQFIQGSQARVFAWSALWRCFGLTAGSKLTDWAALWGCRKTY